MARPKQILADIKELKILNQKWVLDTRPVVVYTMRHCGCTFTEIAEVFDISRQMAETLYKNAREDLYLLND